jgi:hypothetical protein
MTFKYECVYFVADAQPIFKKNYRVLFKFSQRFYISTMALYGSLDLKSDCERLPNSKSLAQQGRLAATKRGN